MDVTDLQVIPLHDICPLPNTGIDARLIGKMLEWSMVCLDNYGVGPPAIVLPLG